ncbi:hypothetical protein AVEN_13855-1 [Araneus ventricosus]|uniref:Uncharacterized protein n=1 Tax=Araneus ventricosus TaxID=182803 RepID=A0A4Y2TG52_ARAVE|nr:hypothetical protein AVEN_13855-1 [Araneus ventricosus]
MLHWSLGFGFRGTGCLHAHNFFEALSPQHLKVLDFSQSSRTQVFQHSSPGLLQNSSYAGFPVISPGLLQIYSLKLVTHRVGIPPLPPNMCCKVFAQ